MAECIPFVTSDGTARLVASLYSDSHIVRVPLDRVNVAAALNRSSRVWLDPATDGVDNLKSRRGQPGNDTWFNLMQSFPHFAKIGTPEYQKAPVRSEVDQFVKALMDRCLTHKPAWITVPQLPFANGSDRNKINRTLAASAGRWKSARGFSGKFILPIVFTHQQQLRGKTARNPKVRQAEWCYREAGAEGFWVVDSSLSDESGSSTLRHRTRAIIDLHQELNERISSKIRIGGPYWGLNLVLWAKGLVDHPAIGIGSGYQYLLPGSPMRGPTARAALPSLRRRVVVRLEFKAWLDIAAGKLAGSHPARAELLEIRRQYTALTAYPAAREQVARFYKGWVDLIAGTPTVGRSMALFQDLSAAYALGKSLPDIAGEKPAKRPEAVAEPLMLSCL